MAPRSGTPDFDPKVVLDTLVPWNQNPRKGHAVDLVARSIEANGFAAPIVARPSDRRILAGHGRYFAAKQLGLKSAPVRWIEMNDEQAAAYTIADNRATELSEWDVDALAKISEQFSVDLTDVGFSDSDLLLLSKIGEPAPPPAGSGDVPDHFEDNGRTRLVVKVKVTDASMVGSKLKEFLSTLGVEYTFEAV